MKKSEFIPSTDVRQLIKVTKTKSSKRIDHPHIRYNQLGRISCIVCGVQIKSEFAWTAHVLSKTHKQNESREPPNTSVLNAGKRLLSDPILPDDTHKLPRLDPDKTDPASSASQVSKVDSSKHSGVADEQPVTEFVVHKNPAEEIVKTESSSQIPEGFFDDGYKDAKARNVPYKDKLTGELELFQKEMNSLERQSDAVMEQESELMVANRELDEIDQQIRKWERIHQLELDKQGLKSKTEGKQQVVDNESSVSTGKIMINSVNKQEPESSDSDESLDELFDFRRKNTTNV